MMIDFVPDETLYPFESRWFDSSAGRVHYLDEGFGPPILFCHGSPTWSFLYRHIVEGLRDRYRCIAVDHLASGCPNGRRISTTGSPSTRRCSAN